MNNKNIWINRDSKFLRIIAIMIAITMVLNMSTAFAVDKKEKRIKEVSSDDLSPNDKIVITNKSDNLAMNKRGEFKEIDFEDIDEEFILLYTGKDENQNYLFSPGDGVILKEDIEKYKLYKLEAEEAKKEEAEEAKETEAEEAKDVEAEEAKDVEAEEAKETEAEEAKETVVEEAKREELTEDSEKYNRKYYEERGNDNNKIIFTKKIDSFRDNKDNPDTLLDNTSDNKKNLYRLYLDVKAEESYKYPPTDFIFLIDRSGSMNIDDVSFDGRKLKRYNAVTKALNGDVDGVTDKGIISSIFKLNNKNSVAVIGFYGDKNYSDSNKDVNIIKDWINNPEFIDASNKKNSGTNYEAALRKASEVLKSRKNNNKKKIMIFINSESTFYFRSSKR